MTSLTPVALNPSLAPTPCADGAEEAWRKAMRRFQSSLQKIKPAMDAYADAEEAMFEARRALEALTPPDSLTVSIQVELYFNDGLSAPILRRHLQDHKLHDEAAIEAYAKDDHGLHAELLAELTAWRAQRASLEAVYQAARAISESKGDASHAAIARSDVQQLRVLRTPAPGLPELFWKIAMLQKADCDDRAEKLGWAYVLQEMKLWTGGEASETVN